jgi:hypothetical protein
MWIDYRPRLELWNKHFKSGKTDAWTHGKLAAEDTWVQVL